MGRRRPRRNPGGGAADRARRLPTRRRRCTSHFRWPKRASIRRRSATRIPTPCASASSIRSIATTISRGRSCSFRTPPKACPRSPTAAARTRSGSGEASTSPHDPAFGGKRRELTADDYVYSIKRVFDPKVRSYWLYLFEQTLVGLEAPLERARKTGNFDYDEKIEGLQALDRYTLRIRFKQPDYAFKWWLTTSSFAAVAREVVEKYQDASHRVMENPVGTGPYRLKAWTRGQRIVLEANPDFRDETYPPAGRDPGDAAIAKGLTGRRLPLAGNVDIAIIEEAQPRMLSFDRGAARLRQRARVARAHGPRRRQAEARAREARRRAAPAERAVARVLLFQPGRSRRRRLRAGEDRAAPRGQPRLRPRGGNPPARERSGGHRRPARSARIVRTRPVDRGQGPIRPGGCARAARPLRLQGPGRRRLSRNAGRQAADARQGLDDRRGGARERRVVEDGTWMRSASG